ncbi:MAG TPA: hypothetical protein VK921_07880, partial [Anditalea sp.]|nr:hypothetical protein [Anditalea sp.]
LKDMYLLFDERLPHRINRNQGCVGMDISNCFKIPTSNFPFLQVRVKVPALSAGFSRNLTAQLG